MVTRSVLIVVVAVALSGSLTGLTAWGQEERWSPCPTPPQGAEQATPTADQLLTNGLPPGIALTVLASHHAENLPAPPARLQLTRLILEPGAGADTRQAVGSILFSVLEGRVTLYVSGQPQTLDQGIPALVQLGDLYAMINEGGMPATLLRLAIAPRDAVDAPVAEFITPEPLLLTPVPPPTSALLFRAEIRDYPLTATRLFLTCLRWEAPAVSSGDFRYPGPVGVRVVSGSLHVDGTRTLPETGCTLLAANATHTLQGADTAPTVLVFGVIPEGQDLWLPPEGAPAVGLPPNPGDLTCGEA